MSIRFAPRVVDGLFFLPVRQPESDVFDRYVDVFSYEPHLFFICGYDFAPVLTHHYGIPGMVARGGRGTHTHTRERTLYNI